MLSNLSIFKHLSNKMQHSKTCNSAGKEVHAGFKCSYDSKLWLSKPLNQQSTTACALLICLHQLNKKAQGHKISPFPLNQASSNLLFSTDCFGYLPL